MSSKSVVIVGCDVSGLSCASYLHKNGFSDVILLEAKERIGGRVSTVRKEDDFFYEAGAQWIHGSHQNIIKAIADQNHVKCVLDEINACDIYVENKGKLSDKSPKLKSINESFKNFEKITNDATEGITSKSYVDMLSYFKKNIKSDKQSKKIYESLLYQTQVLDGCNSLKDVSFSGYTQYKVCPGGNFSVIKGLDDLIAKIASKLPDNWFKLNRKVVRIDWSCLNENRYVIVEVLNILTGLKEVYKANYVVSTLPLGFLKNNHQSIFKPILPSKKINSIKKLGFGSVAKVILRYSNEFLKENSTKLYLLRKDTSDFGYYNVSMTKCFGNDEIFMTLWLSGKDAIKVEEFSEEKLKKIFTKDLQKFIPNIPFPKSAYVTKWTADPYTSGAYSFIAVNSNFKDFEVLAEPLIINYKEKKVVKVLFAGEATHTEYFSTMHGAYETGEREAKRIIEMCN